MIEGCIADNMRKWYQSFQRIIRVILNWLAFQVHGVGGTHFCSSASTHSARATSFVSFLLFKPSHEFICCVRGQEPQPAAS